MAAKSRAEAPAALERWREATRTALLAGASEAELAELLQAEAEARKEPDMVTELEEERIFDVLPPGLIDVPSAVRKYGLSRYTLHAWLRKGRLRVAGRVRGLGRGGGQLVIAEDELVEYMAAPRDVGGRPKKPNTTC